MTLLTLMYHHGQRDRHGNAPEMLDAHFAHIARHHACVLPGEALAADRLNVCLTFDDGYRDFHDVVWPLLVRHGLRAVLAVPGGAIQDRRPQADDGSVAIDGASTFGLRDLCTWSELRTMAASGHVRVAAHGFSHRALDDDGVDLHTEVVVPKTLIAGRIDHEVDSFVFPFGRFSPLALREVQRHYRYVFRIGGADNQGWNDRVIYRVEADRMIAPDAIFTAGRRRGYTLRRHWNRLRGR